MKRLKLRTSGAIGMLTGVAMLAAACGGGGGGSTTTTASGNGGNNGTSAGKTGGTLTYALDEDFATFNVNTSEGALFTLQEALDPVWPTAFIPQPDTTVKMSSVLLESAQQTSSSPQTIVYKINPKAVWSDGVPLNAADFIYNWQAQSGLKQYTDVGGKTFDTASNTGYDQIKSVTGSGAGNDTVTVVFSTPFSDWRSLFGDLVPAHIAKKVSWNTGFGLTDLKNVLSAGPYMFQSYTTGQNLIEVRNPKYWGPKGKLDKIVYQFVTDDTQDPTALQNNEVQLVNPQPQIDLASQLKAIPNNTYKDIPGLEFEHFDFNQRNFYLKQAAVREAIAHATDRAEIIRRTVGQIDPGIKPLGNRIYVNTQPQYQDNGKSYDTPNLTEAASLLTSVGMKKVGASWIPSNGPEAGKPLTFSLSTTTSNALRQATEEVFQSEMAAFGIKINIANADAKTLFGTDLPKGQFDIAEFAWVSTPFPSGNLSIYCSYTNATACGQNYDYYANPALDAIMNKAATATSTSTATSLWNQADQILWKDMVTLPLFQKPQLYAWSNAYVNIVPNPTSWGVPWNAQDWALKS